LSGNQSISNMNDQRTQWNDNSCCRSSGSRETNRAVVNKRTQVTTHCIFRKSVGRESASCPFTFSVLEPVRQVSCKF